MWVLLQNASRQPAKLLSEHGGGVLGFAPPPASCKTSQCNSYASAIDRARGRANFATVWKRAVAALQKRTGCSRPACASACAKPKHRWSADVAQLRNFVSSRLTSKPCSWWQGPLQYREDFNIASPAEGIEDRVLIASTCWEDALHVRWNPDLAGLCGP